MNRTAAVAACLLVGGCVSAVTPRLADVAPKGRVTVDGTAQPISVADGEATTSDGGRHRGNAAPAEQAEPPMMVPAVLLQLNAGARVGVGGGCEAGGMVGALRLAVEARCQVLDALTVGAAVGYTPFFGRGGVWGRAGVDASRRWGGHGVLFGAYASYGNEAYSVDVEVPPEDPDGSSPFAAMVRREARASAAVGIVFLQRDPEGVPMGDVFAVSLVPYLTVWHDDPQLECRHCAAQTVRTFETGVGGALVLTMSHIPGL